MNGSRSTRCRSSSTATCHERGRALASKMRELIPRQMLRWPSRRRSEAIIARIGEGLAQEILAKCYGGDISRKRKLLDRRKASA